MAAKDGTGFDGFEQVGWSAEMCGVDLHLEDEFGSGAGGSLTRKGHERCSGPRCESGQTQPSHIFDVHSRGASRLRSALPRPSSASLRYVAHGLRTITR